MGSTCQFWLKVSRPGLWFATLWLYLLPTSQMTIWGSLPFWLGFVYCCFPLNFLVYGWNDIVDQPIDALNPRKDSFLFGALGTREQLRRLWKPIVITQVVFFTPLILWGGWKLVIVLLGLLLVNTLYNLPGRGLRSCPPWEVLCQSGYLLVVPFSMWLNQTPGVPWPTYLYLMMFAAQSHLIGEVMDIDPDRQAGRRTTATVLGVKRTKGLIIGIVFSEVLLLFLVFKDFLFGGMLAGFLLWLVLDLLLVFKGRTYSLGQLKLFSAMSNLTALLSMIYVWRSGCLLRAV